MEIIVLSGYARSGKDTVANILVENEGFTRVAFADKLREMLYALDPWVWKYEKGMKVWSPLQAVIDEYGWDGYKDTWYSEEVRRLLQRLGTEAGRKTLWDSIWIDAALTGHPDDARLVISDGRFYNEFDAVVARGGYAWRVDRPGVGPANDHLSETEAVDYPRFSLKIVNNGTLEELENTVLHHYRQGRYKEWGYA